MSSLSSMSSASVFLNTSLTMAIGSVLRSGSSSASWMATQAWPHQAWPHRHHFLQNIHTNLAMHSPYRIVWHEPPSNQVRSYSVAEPPNLMPPKSAHLPLDTKHSGENNKLLGSVRHTPGENPKSTFLPSGSQMRE